MKKPIYNALLDALEKGEFYCISFVVRDKTNNIIYSGYLNDNLSKVLKFDKPILLKEELNKDMAIHQERKYTIERVKIFKNKSIRKNKLYFENNPGFHFFANLFISFEESYINILEFISKSRLNNDDERDTAIRDFEISMINQLKLQRKNKIKNIFKTIFLVKLKTYDRSKRREL